MFRKLRKRLLESGAAGKYLLYAIGEILLVVFGILIALEVNNWNEGRRERAEEIEILKSVQKDLAHTIEELRFLNQVRDKVLYGTKGLFEMAGKETIEERKMDSLVGLTFYRPTFNNKEGAIDLLFSSGKINLIRNDSIRELLLAWPGLIDDMVEEEDIALDVFQNYYYPVVSNYTVLEDILVHATSTAFFGTEIREMRYTALPQEKNYEGLLKDRNFLNHLRMRATHMRITNGEVMDLIAHAQKLIGMIEIEITK